MPIFRHMNRRSEPRFDVYYRARIIPVDQPEACTDALLTDISGGGMRLVATKALDEDQLICVEVGQHLVLAEVRSSVPRGSRFLIGAEKIHTFNLLTLPESLSLQDRIQALIDDYHLRIQFALESNGGSDNLPKKTQPVTAATIPSVAELPTQELSKTGTAPVAGPSVQSDNMALEPRPDSVGPAVAPIVAVTNPSPESLSSEVKTVPQQHLPQGPSLAPPMRTDPAPAEVPPLPVSGAVEVDFGQLRIILPDVGRQEIAPMNSTDSNSPASAPEVATSPDLPRPVQPIWMTPPGAGTADNAVESDPLRALAIQHDLAEPQPIKSENNSRTIAFLVAGLLAAVVLISVLFGPIRHRALALLPNAAAHENRDHQTQPPEKTDAKDLVIQVSPESANPPAAESQPVPVQPPSAVQAPPKQANPPKSSGPGIHSSSIRTLAPSWIWACVDDKPLTGRVLPGGSDLEIDFSHGARVLVGNAGAVEMTLDGKPLGSLGPEGHARIVELTPEGFHLAATASQDCGNR